MGNNDSVPLKPEEQPGQGGGAPVRGGGEEQPGRGRDEAPGRVGGGAPGRVGGGAPVRGKGGARGPGPEVARDKDKTFNINLSLIPFHFLGYIFPWNV